MDTLLIIKQRKQVTLPNPVSATLPTAEDLENAGPVIGDAFLPNNVTPYYYLRTPGEEKNTVLVAVGSDTDEGTEPGYFDIGPGEDVSYGTGNRPVILFDESLYECGAHLGDEFWIEEWPFTVIGEKIAIADRYISVDVYDKRSANYEKSAIKKRVDQWFKEEILDRLD